VLVLLLEKEHKFMAMLHKILIYFFGSNAGVIDRAGFWTGVSALMTGLAAVVAIVAIIIAVVQLRAAAKTARADFGKRFADSFFTTETRELFTLLMNSALKFQVMDIFDKDGKKIDYLPIFTIDREVARQLEIVVKVESTRTAYSAFDMDDLLLGHFDDIGWYENEKLMDRGAIQGTFGYYVTTAYKNEEVQKYLKFRDNIGKYKEFHRL
jgi:hypothetical protein